MSNLGWYQSLTTLAKKVGGPQNLVAGIFALGAFAGGGIVAVGSALKKMVSDMLEQKRQDIEKAISYTVNVEGQSNEGLLFKKGDTFKVIEKDGDAALIIKDNDENNPHFVSRKFLSSISDYECK